MRVYGVNLLTLFDFIIKKYLLRIQSTMYMYFETRVMAFLTLLNIIVMGYSINYHYLQLKRGCLKVFTSYVYKNL